MYPHWKYRLWMWTDSWFHFKANLCSHSSNQASMLWLPMRRGYGNLQWSHWRILSWWLPSFPNWCKARWLYWVHWHNLYWCWSSTKAKVMNNKSYRRACDSCGWCLKRVIVGFKGLQSGIRCLIRICDCQPQAISCCKHWQVCPYCHCESYMWLLHNQIIW